MVQPTAQARLESAFTTAACQQIPCEGNMISNADAYLIHVHWYHRYCVDMIDTLGNNNKNNSVKSIIIKRF